MKYLGQRSLELLRAGTGISAASFREGQEEAVCHVVEGRGRLLVVQRTGWGKSFVYFIATKLLREQGAGPTLLVSPLISLMRNQVQAAERMGVRAVTIHRNNLDEWDLVEERLQQNEVDILLVTPERFENQRFQAQVLSAIGARVGLLVIDEAHCISDWGHDFRPHYRRLERVVRALPNNLQLLATTATANQRVLDDLHEVLGPDLTISRGNLSRPSLALQTIQLPTQAERLAWLAEQIPRLPGTGIIYALTVRDAERVAGWLRSRAIEAAAYTGNSGEYRPELEQDLLASRVKALVATTALGMGFDKPDLGFVIHFQSPGSVVAYYQQVGRAGRGVRGAYGVLLSGDEEARIADFFIDTAFPTREEVQAVLGALEAAPAGLVNDELFSRVNASEGRIEKALELLSLESPAPIVRDGFRWQLSAAKISEGFWARADRLTQLRRNEQKQMQEYVQLASGHMDFLMGALDSSAATPPSHDLQPLSSAVDPSLLLEAGKFLGRTALSFEPRKKWPPGGMPKLGVQVVIPARYEASPGRTLCFWGDPHWGDLIRKGKYVDGRFVDELVAASADLIRAWAPSPAPVWVTCIPSARHPTLVPDLSQRLATALGLPFRIVLRTNGERPEQKTMANSTRQARNLDGAWLVARESILAAPVLLVDDMVDSRWTMTVAAYLLRTCGCGKVWPFALAMTSRAE